MHADFRMHEWSDSQNQEWGSKYVKKIKAEKKIKDAARDKCWARTRLKKNFRKSLFEMIKLSKFKTFLDVATLI